MSLPEADDPDFESLGIAGHLKCEGDLRGVKDDLFQTIGGEKQNLKRFRPAFAEAASRRQVQVFLSLARLLHPGDHQATGRP